MMFINFLIRRFAESFNLWRKRPMAAVFGLIFSFVLLFIAARAFSNFYGFNSEEQIHQLFGMMAIMGLITALLCNICGWWCNRLLLKKTATIMATKMTPRQQAREWLRNCVILDVETTGLDKYAEIVEISIIDEQGHILLNTLVKPLEPIPDDVIAIHGITNEMVASAPSWAAVYEQVAAILASKPLVIYNAAYDLRLIAQTNERHGLPAIEVDAECAMLTYAEFYGEWDMKRNTYRWQRLGYAAQQQGITIDGQAHRSLSDVKTTLGIIQAMAA